MTWGPEIAAIVSGALVALAFVWRMDFPRVMRWLEGRSQIAKLDVEAKHALTKALRSRDERIEQLERSERELRANVDLLVAEVRTLSDRIRAVEAERDTLRHALTRATKHNAELAEENSNLRLNPQEKSIATIHRYTKRGVSE